MIRAKFICVSKTIRRGRYWDPKTQQAELRNLYEYEFQVVSDGSEENKEFFASTPGGTLKLNAVRGDLFEPNESYYLDFTLAPERTEVS